MVGVGGYNIWIPASDGSRLAAWFCPALVSGSSSGCKRPVVVCAGGLGVIKEMRLPAYMSAFSSAAYHCVAFDYRCFGESTGMPRQLLDFESQQADWKCVIEWVVKNGQSKGAKGGPEASKDSVTGAPSPLAGDSLPNFADLIDPTQIALFGTSFGGGHVIKLSSQLPALGLPIKCSISQCPFTDGYASSKTVKSIYAKLYVGIWGATDKVSAVVRGKDAPPITIPLAAKDGQPALMNAPDVYANYISQLPASIKDNFVNAVSARTALSIPFLVPGSYAASVQIPILYAICGKDSVAPAQTTRRYAQESARGEIAWFEEEGHFDLYQGQGLEKATRRYVQFLQAHLK
ncbi:UNCHARACTERIZED [Ceraceosorus bombacis]|uniref:UNCHARACTERIZED n=1 Tax=Ceraceosorus bombacis TaxID=401625 RepID=A0A0P1BGK2_9BASI|nr:UNCHARACTERIZED [Ceraceosorus bombacis]